MNKLSATFNVVNKQKININDVNKQRINIKLIFAYLV